MSILREQIAGLDLGDGYLAAALWTATDRKARLKRGATLVEDIAYQDPHRLTRQIRRLWRAARIRTLTVNVLVRPPSLVLKRFAFDNITRADLDPALRLEAEATLQTPPDEIVSDFNLFEEPPPGAQGVFRGLLAAAPRDEVEPLVEAVRRAGLYPIAADTGVAALGNVAQACARQLSLIQEPTCLLHAGRRTVDLAVISPGSNDLYPGSFFTRSNEALRAQTYLVENVVDHLKYYHVKLRRPPVRRVLIGGLDETRSALQEFLRQRLDLPVEAWDPLGDGCLSHSLKHKVAAGVAHSSLLVGAAGAALRIFE